MYIKDLATIVISFECLSVDSRKVLPTGSKYFTTAYIEKALEIIGREDVKTKVLVIWDLSCSYISKDCEESSSPAERCAYAAKIKAFPNVYLIGVRDGFLESHIENCLDLFDDVTDMWGVNKAVEKGIIEIARNIVREFIEG